MKNMLLAGSLVLGALAAAPITATAAWAPSGPIKMLISVAPGGAVDTQARLIAEYLRANYDWDVIPENMPGAGGMTFLKALKGEPNDGTAIGFALSDTLTYDLQASGTAGLSASDFAPIVTTATNQLGLVGLASKGWKTIDDVVATAKAGTPVRMAVSSPKFADISYLIEQHYGISFNFVNVSGGRDVMNGVAAGDIDLGWMGGAQEKAVKAGEMVNVLSGLEERLIASPDTPTLKEVGIDIKGTGGTYMMFVAPAGIPAEARTALAEAIAATAGDPGTKAGEYITKVFGKSTVVSGDDLDALVAQLQSGAEWLLETTGK